MDELKVYWVDGRELSEIPAHDGYDVAVCYQPAVEEHINYWKNLYLEPKEELRKNSQDYAIEEMENE